MGERALQLYIPPISSQSGLAAETAGQARTGFPEFHLTASLFNCGLGRPADQIRSAGLLLK